MQLPSIPLPIDPSYWWAPYSYGDYVAELSLLVGVLTLVAACAVAFRQLQVMRDQTVLALEQRTMARRMQETTAEQGRIALKQYEIAERQDRILQEQTLRRPNLEAWAHLRCMKGDDLTVLVRVKNTGAKTALQWYWHLAVHQGLNATVWLPKREDPLTPNRVTGSMYDTYSGYGDAPIFAVPKSEYALVLLRTKTSSLMPITEKILWHFGTEDGRSPMGPGDGETSLQRARRMEDPPWPAWPLHG